MNNLPAIFLEIPQSTAQGRLCVDVVFKPHLPNNFVFQLQLLELLQPLFPSVLPQMQPCKLSIVISPAIVKAQWRL